MATYMACDGCRQPIHEWEEDGADRDAFEDKRKYRIDLYETGTGKRGFDLCGECFTKIRDVVPKYGELV